jgi:hypothetical protein
LAAFTAPPAAPSSSGVTPRDGLPRPGDRWRYRVQDQFRLGDLFLTAQVESVGPEGVTETWSTTSDTRVRTATASLQPGFHELPGWNLTPPEYSPYLLAAGALKPGQVLPDLPRRVEQVIVPLRGRVEGEEDVVVGAGRFRAVKVVLRGQVATRGAARAAPLVTEYVAWYSPQVRRTVKYTVSTRVGEVLKESTTFELVEFKAGP